MAHPKRKHSHLEYRQLVGLGPRDKLPDLVCLANAEDEATGDASEVYAFRKPAGRYGIVRVPREKAFSADSLAQALIAKNAQLPRIKEEAIEKVTTASGMSPLEHWLFAANEGWQQGNTAFVHRSQIFGRSQVAGLKLKPPVSDQSRKYPLKVKGSLDVWMHVVRYARLSSRLRLALCAAFAAPLLHIVDLQSFMIALGGQSKTGKSTALLAAGSVIGIGREGALPNFNATTAALQEVAVEFVDRVFPVNELGLVNGGRKDAYSKIRPLTYRYSEGQDTARHSKSTYGHPGSTARWRGIMLVSTENSFESLAAMAGEKRDEGEYARAFDVPAVSRDNTTIFDAFPPQIPTDDRDAWARQHLAKLRRLIAANHGYAFDVYAEFLVSHSGELEAWVRDAMQQFTAKLPNEDLSGALQHAAQNFALLYAGAVVAKKAGLTPGWWEPTTLQALRRCFMDGLGEAQRTETTKTRVRAKVLQAIDNLPSVDKVTEAKRVDGWYEGANGKNRTFAVRVAAFKTWFPEKTDLRAAIHWLHSSKLLKLKDGAAPDPLNLEWASVFKKLPGQPRSHRCYCFRDPASMK